MPIRPVDEFVVSARPAERGSQDCRAGRGPAARDGPCRGRHGAGGRRRRPTGRQRPAWIDSPVPRAAVVPRTGPAARTWVVLRTSVVRPATPGHRAAAGRGTGWLGWSANRRCPTATTDRRDVRSGGPEADRVDRPDAVRTWVGRDPRLVTSHQGGCHSWPAGPRRRARPAFTACHRIAGGIAGTAPDGATTAVTVTSTRPIVSAGPALDPPICPHVRFSSTDRPAHRRSPTRQATIDLEAQAGRGHPSSGRTGGRA